MSFDDLDLTELIRLQSHLSEVLVRKFEKPLALAFTDVVGSSEYTAKNGDEAGRVLQQRHLDHVAREVAAHGGRIVDTAGDGAFCAFASPSQAISAMAALQRALLEEATEPRVRVRVGVHFARVLTDGVIVSGDGVNFCARVASSAAPGELRISRALFHELASDQRALCKALPLVALKGFGEGIPLFAFEWRDPTRFPIAVRVVETGVEHVLPDKDLITLGRLRETPEGVRANDIVLTLPDADKAVLISRWHVELRRLPDGLAVRTVGGGATELDGAPLPKGTDVPVRVGARLRLSNVLTLEFSGESVSKSALSTRGG